MTRWPSAGSDPMCGAGLYRSGLLGFERLGIYRTLDVMRFLAYSSICSSWPASCSSRPAPFFRMRLFGTRNARPVL